MNSVILASPIEIALAEMVFIFLLLLAVVAGTAVVLIVYFSRQKNTPVTNPPSAAAATQILPRKCPRCGAVLKPDAPEGLCPACLLQRGIATEGAPPPGQPGFVPPPVAEIARLFPQLEILGLIGKGGMGAVYQARQPALDRLVALKILPPAVASDPGFAERFNREARTLARLNHPNIVGIYDFGSVGQASRLSPSQTQNDKSDAGGLPVPLWYLLMEFVDGTNLRELEGAGKLSPEQALAIVPQICEALQFAHNEGIVHRDIKPENLLLDKKGRVKITDFGIAKIVGAPAGKISLTGARDVVGTPHYMAPEQIEQPLTVDHRADIFSLGVVFYEMLTGELPLGKFAPPSRKVEVDVRLDEVVLHALEKEPARRYQQASQVKTDVETIAGTPPAVAGFAAQPIAQPSTFPVSAGLVASDKAILPAFLLAFFFGIFGAHRFYVGKVWSALLQLAALGIGVLMAMGCIIDRQRAPVILTACFLFGCAVWTATDVILLLCKAFRDGQGRRMTRWLHPQPGDIVASASPTAGRPPIPPNGGASPSAGSGAQFSPLAPGTPPRVNTAMIVAPAVGLMVAAGWKLLRAFTALFFFSGHSIVPWLGPFLENLGIGPIFGLVSVSIVFYDVLPALLILFGAIQMIQLRSYAWSLAAGIVAIVACSLVSLPMGIWALIVLARPDVRAVFAQAAAVPSSPHRHRPWLLATMAVMAMVIVGLIAALVLELLNFERNQPSLALHGRVTDAVTGQPIAGARVAAEYDHWGSGWPAQSHLQESWTGTEGLFELSMWQGPCHLSASAPGFETDYTDYIPLAKPVLTARDFALQPTNANRAVSQANPAPAISDHASMEGNLPKSLRASNNVQFISNLLAVQSVFANSALKNLRLPMMPKSLRASNMLSEWAREEEREQSYETLLSKQMLLSHASNIESTAPRPALEQSPGDFSISYDAVGIPPVPAMALAPSMPPIPAMPPAPPAAPVQPGDNSGLPPNLSGLPPTLRFHGAPKTPGKLTTTDEFQEDFSRTLPLAAQGRFSLDNINGRVEITGWDRNEVSIKALKHGQSAESLEAVNLIVTANPGDVAVHTKLPSGTTGPSSFWRWLFNGGRPKPATVDYAVQVPQNAQLKEISSVNGHIVIEDVSGDIQASTVNGELQVTGAAANLNLSTVNGRIEAGLGLLGSGQSVSLNTVNGQIEATLPATAGANVSAATLNGSISSEFPGLVAKKEFPAGRELHGTLGNGGARVSANTVNGGIHFRRGTEAR